uniref:NMDA receptor synaptonuclear signaling and neuronal migration factor n=1 Tax=Eptatretus burgeri TaxID=7764 RepID=A0A8C4QB66_EPTBU
MVGRQRGRGAVSLDRQDSRDGRLSACGEISQSKSDPILDSRFSSQEEGTRAGGKFGLRDPVVDINSVNWDAEKEAEANACKGADFIPPKVMLISSKVPKAEYIPTIIRRDDPSIIAILYDHEHASFTDIIEEIERKLNEYHRGCRAWKLLLYCQGGPGYLYLLKNKVVTFAKLEKEEDLILFWKCLGGLMSKMNPEVNVINIMGCYVLGNQNGEKLFESLLAILHPYHTALEAPLELSAQGKKMIETYFNLRLYKLWRVRQHSRMANNFDDIV